MTRPDALSEVLDLLRLRGEVFCRSVFTSPWAVSFPSGAAQFHVVERGTCLVHAPRARKSVRLVAGDLAVLPHGDHVLFDRSGQRATPLEKLIVRPGAKVRGMLRFGGGGVETRLICGAFHLDSTGREALLAMLPPVLHVPGQSGRPLEWLDLTLRFLASETSEEIRPGTILTMSRLVDLMFVQAVRVWLAKQPKGAAGWLGAMRDPQIGLAINAIHAEPSRDWTVDSLAQLAAMSRSLFASRFAALVGDPPLKYVTRWRMQVAARRLADEKLRVSEAAALVGYDSEAAFSRAFKRHLGVPPLTFRRLPVAPRTGSAAGRSARSS
jgi:AraC-like DNA-binding protein